MIDFFSLRTVGVNCQQVCLGYPRWGAVFHVFTSVIQTSGVERIVRPPFPTRCIDGIYVLFVDRLLLLRDFLSVLRVCFVAILSPLVLILTIFSKVSSRSSFAVSQRTGFAHIGNGRAFFVIGAARFLNFAYRTNLAFKRLGAWFHNRDIIARWGDVKQGEFGGR